MQRPLKATLAVAAIVSTVAGAAALVPVFADASSPTPSGCSSAQAAVDSGQAVVDHDIHALVKAESTSAKTAKAKRHKAAAVASAKKVLAKDQSLLATAHQDLVECEVSARPTPTVTASATATATATVTATSTTTVTAAPTSTTTPYVPVWRDGTTLLTELNADGSEIAPLSSWDGVEIAGTGFGSAWTADPSNPGFFYGLTDRGPNVTAPDGSAKLEPLAGFQDTIGYFHKVDGHLLLVRTIGLTMNGGEPMSGLENTEADAGETILDMYGDTLPHSASGLDTEGIVALPDGTFWISDEYGPFIVHFDATGKEIGRFDPYVTAAGTSATFDDVPVNPLPGELKRRKANKGMEGLTVTPDGDYLVGIMQSSLDKNKGTSTATGTASAAGAITRIVKISLTDPSDVHEYLYSLHTKGQASNPAGEAVSEITALTNNTFVVDERDGKFEGTSNGTVGGTNKADKNLWRVDLSSATDVGPSSPLIGTSIAGGAATWDATSGLNIAGKSIEDIAGTRSDADAIAALSTAGVTTGSESLYLNYAALVTAVDPTGMYFGHDKVEGVAVDTSDPNIVYISNDSDFGITDLPSGPNPTANKRAKGYHAEKFLPDGTTQDFGEILVVDMSQVPALYKSPS